MGLMMLLGHFHAGYRRRASDTPTDRQIACDLSVGRAKRATLKGFQSPKASITLAERCRYARPTKGFAVWSVSAFGGQEVLARQK
jgi:hypothetical protein